MALFPPTLIITRISKFPNVYLCIVSSIRIKLRIALCVSQYVSYRFFKQFFEQLFLHMGQGFPHQLPVLKNVILHPHVRRVACDEVTIPRALLLYKIAFNLLGSSLKQLG